MKDHQELADFLIEKGFDRSDCQSCVFFSKSNKNPVRVFCNHPSAVAVRMLLEARRRSNLDTSGNYFPTVVFKEDENAEEVVFPAIIASEYGVSFGLVDWPDNFDPIWLYLCLFYQKKDDQRNLEANTE